MKCSRASYLILLTLMLLMQSAVAAHSVEHDIHGHTELCTAFLSAEKITAVDVSSPLFLDRHFTTLAISHSKQYYFSKTSSAYASRAPPLS